MHLLYKRVRNLNLPLDLQLHLLDHTILPIALFGCELWGLENIQLIEFFKKILRRITNLNKKSTHIYMLYAELRRMPVEIIDNPRSVKLSISRVLFDLRIQ